MINLVWSGLLTVLLLTGCGSGGTPTRHNDFVPLTSIEITAVSPTIAAGTSTTLSVKGNFSGQFTRDITDQAVWSSDNTDVASFSTAATPRINGHVAGTANLTASVAGVSATNTLTVSSATITTLTITPAAPIISKGLTTQFTVTGTFSDNTTQDLTFDAVWDSSAPAAATVSDAAGNKGFAQAIAAGTSTIRAAFGGVSGTTLLTVTEPVLQSITVTPANPSILSLSTGSFQATGHFSDGTTPDLTSQVAWSSSNPDIATITSPGGVASTFAQGTTSITATINGVQGTTNLKVTGGNLLSFTVSPATPILVKGTVARMTVIGSFDNNSSRDITGVVVWSPANTALASVTTPGGNLALLNALELTPTLTPTIVTATVIEKPGIIPATTNLTVTASVPSFLSIAIPPTSLPALTTGTSARFTATANFIDGSPLQDVTANATWTSSDITKATVGDSGLDKGRVTGVAAGFATITATYVGVGGVKVTAPVTTVTVTAATLQSLTISPLPAAVGSGNQVKFTATANYIGSTILDVTEDTTWSIDNKNVAILADSTSQPGQVVGVDSGSATLTATFGGKTATATVIVP